MNDIDIDILWQANEAGGLQEWALIVGGVTAIAAVIVAVVQYISSSRAQERAHMHSIFREYLTVRMNAPRGKQAAVIGYRYYAMEEVYYWLIKQKLRRKIPLRMKDDEYRSWENTIKHHVSAEKDSNAYKYFDRNQLLFGIEYRAFVCNILKLDVKVEKSSANAKQGETDEKEEAAVDPGSNAPPPSSPQAPGPS